MPHTPLFKVVFGLPDGRMTHCPAVQYEGQIWLVPKWLPFPDEGYMKPERMIQLAQFRHLKFDPPAKGNPIFDGANFGISDPVPIELIEGDLSKLKDKYVVLDKPDAKFRSSSADFKFDAAISQPQASA